MNNLIPICVNCKYFLSEPTGIHRLKSACAISAIDPVTGEETGKAKHAGQYRKDTGLCGPSGKFYIPSDKPVVKKEKAKEEVKTVEVNVPDLIISSSTLEDKIKNSQDMQEKANEIGSFAGGVTAESTENRFLESEEVANLGLKQDKDGTILKPEAELLPLEEGKKRRRRAK